MIFKSINNVQNKEKSGELYKATLRFEKVIVKVKGIDLRGELRE